MDWGLKVSKPGKSITSNDPRDLLLSSKYQMFKYHGIYDTSAVFVPGDITKTVSITHGLGYVPAFIPYVFDDFTNKLYIIPSYPYGVDYPVSVSAWADTDKIYFKYDIHGYIGAAPGWNVKEYTASDVYNDYVPSNVDYGIGRAGSTPINGAIRFPGVDLSSGDSIASATVTLYIAAKVDPGGGATVKWTTYGIDEDNTGDFTSSPMGRTRTSASGNSEMVLGGYSVGSTVDISVTSQLNEIKGRGGWASGNNMGFLFIENSGTNATYFQGAYTDTHTLRVLLAGNLTVNFRAIVFKDKIHD